MTQRLTWLSLLLIAMAVGAVRADEFQSDYRHEHFFLVWNDAKEPPTFTLGSKQFGKYPDTLSYQVIDADSRMLAEGEVPLNSRQKITGLSPSPKYLVAADPGYNGVTIETAQPYGIVGSRQHPLGLNRPMGCLFLYVPAGCDRFTIVVKSASPGEGAWVKVLRPDGGVANEAEGELDNHTSIGVPVPEEYRGKVWTVQFDKPKTPKVRLDDLNLFVRGKLAPLFVPRKEWAERYGKTVKSGEN